MFNFKLSYDRKDIGNIDTDSEVFQLGGRLYEAQCLWSDINSAKKEGKTIDISNEKIQEILDWYCELVAWTGQLKAEYDILVDAIDNKVKIK